MLCKIWEQKLLIFWNLVQHLLQVVPYIDMVSLKTVFLAEHGGIHYINTTFELQYIKWGNGQCTHCLTTHCVLLINTSGINILDSNKSLIGFLRSSLPLIRSTASASLEAISGMSVGYRGSYKWAIIKLPKFVPFNIKKPFGLNKQACLVN